MAAELIRRGLDGTGAARAEPHIPVDPLTGLPVVSFGRVVTPEDVAALDDAEA